MRKLSLTYWRLENATARGRSLKCSWNGLQELLQDISRCMVPSRMSFCSRKDQADSQPCRYLENGNILAARTFINHFVHKFTAAYPAFTSTTQPNPIPLGTEDGITLTTDGTMNFAQVAVRLCQRAQGDKNKMMKESWIRLCGTYQSRGGVLAQNEVRKVRGLIMVLILNSKSL